MLSNHVEKIQNYTMRLITKNPPRTRSEPLRHQLSWTSEKTKRHSAGGLHMPNWKYPPYLTHKFVSNAKFGYNTRGASKLHLKIPNSNFYRNSFKFQGALLFNKLPDPIRSLKTKLSFKNTLLHSNFSFASQCYFRLCCVPLHLKCIVVLYTFVYFTISCLNSVWL